MTPVGSQRPVTMPFERHSKGMRSLLVGTFLLPLAASACTAFTVTHGGRTFIGCNEDAWSINANVRFEQGRDGQYGAIYFAHYNGHPMRAISDQMGMNEAGLVFDGLVLGLGPIKQRTNMPALETSDAIRHIMRACANVQEVEAYLRTVNTGPVVGQLFFCDAQGGYLVLEPDTLFTGNDPWYALGNWRMSTCSDPATIPIPRLQTGRQLLMNGAGATIESAEEVLSSMKVCRKNMGEGTLFSVLFDPTEAKARLYFYHDMRESVTFDLQEELAKGDRRIDMASLFGPRPEYDRLKSYLTPFHQRWLFWSMFGVAVLAGILGTVNLFQLLARALAKLRCRFSGSMITPVLSGLALSALIGLIGVLLMQETVYYFGLGSVHPALVWAPVLIAVLGCAFMWLSKRNGTSSWMRVTIAALLLPMLLACSYWGMLMPW